ncbi:MAG: transposase, partial [Planctomycetota bacterium]
FSDPRVDFSQPSETNSGRYWYNLHLVLVTASRFRMGGAGFLAKMRDSCLQTAAENDCRIAELSIMPDHLHMALRGSVDMSPTSIGLAFQNNTARVGGCRWWQDDFYVGTFSEYDLGALRKSSN